MLLQEGPFLGPGPHYSGDVFPHSQLHKQPSIPFSEFTRQQHLQQPATVTDPTMGRTNIPMPLPPGSTYSIDGTSVTLTPLSPPQVQPGQEGMVTGLEVPYAHHAHPGGYPRTFNGPQGIPMSADAVLGSGKGYMPFHPQNGSVPQSVPQAFFGTNRLFPETEPFHFKFGGQNLSHVGANPNPFHFQQGAGAGGGGTEHHRAKSERTRHTYSHSSGHHGNRRESSHDDSQMMSVVVQR